MLIFSSCNSDSATDPQEEDTAAQEPKPDLITAPDAAVPLSSFAFADSTLLLPDYSQSPQAQFDINTVVPHAKEEALNLKINKDLASLMAGDEVPIKVDNLPQTLQSAVATTLYNYRRQAVDSSEVGEMPHAYALTLSYETEVLLNADGLLSLGTHHYSYSGGAHGNYYTALRTYATSSSSALLLADVFMAEALTKLNSLIKAKIDPDRLYAPEEPVEATENFALTEEGITFNYHPYEIGPYAAGEIEVLLSFADIKDILTPEAQKLVAAL